MRVWILAGVFWSFAAVGWAQTLPDVAVETFHAPPDPHWRAIASEDVKAAYRLLKDNHPAAASELHDAAFLQRLNAGYTLALERAQKIDSYQGYLATLDGFATGMGDKHIWSRPTFVLNMPRWPEFLVSKRGNQWVVTDTETSRAALKGASLLSCDGEPVAELARKNLGGFHAVWSIGAQQIQSAPWLMVDEGNPFIKRPGVCVFDLSGKQVTVTLQWVRIKRDNLLPRLKAAGGAGAAGFGVRRVGEGYWIALQDLISDHALEVQQAVEQQKAQLRDARFVVLDMRGNPGGSTEIGRQIAVSLLGRAIIDGRLGSEDSNDCGSNEIYRATPDNLAQLKYFRTTPVVANGSPEIQRLLAQQEDQVRAALAAGREFSAPLDCTAPPVKPDPTQAPPSLMKGQLILLTDNACFSSCLGVTDDWRKLGALHVGQTTDADTQYGEVREQYLPSGYSLFSTLQAVAGNQKPSGPFDPTVVYNGNIADTAAVEAWITGTVSGRSPN